MPYPSPAVRLCVALALLAIPRTPAETLESTSRPIWQGPGVNTLGAPSRDGRWLSYVHAPTGDLAVRELATGNIRFVTRKDPKTQQKEFAYFSVISPDGKSAAYAWFNDQGFYDLRIGLIQEEGVAPENRVLYRNREAGFVQPCAFSPDGKHILTLFFRRDNISQIALVSVEDGSARVLKSLNWIYPKRMDFSPDGRWIVYDNLSREGAEERDLFVLATDGAGERRLLEGPANDLAPLWSLNGREVLFLSDRFGAPAICAVPIEEGRTAGQPRLLRRNVSRALPMGITATGQLFYGVRAGNAQIHIAELGGEHSPGRLDLGAEDKTGAVFSPDGTVIAYLALRGSENYGLAHRGLMLYSLATRAWQELPVKLAHVERLTWSPDGRSILISGSDRRARGGLYEYELETGRTKSILIIPETGYAGPEAAYAGSGGPNQIIYVRPGSPWALIAFDPSGDAQRVLYEAPAGRKLMTPAVSQDGEAIAFSEVTEGPDADADVFLMNLSTLKKQKLFALPSGRVTSLSWMPGGAALLAGTEGASGARLWRVSAAGDRMEPVLSLRNLQPGVSVHPDGRRIALSLGATYEEVWVLDYADPDGPVSNH